MSVTIIGNIEINVLITLEMSRKSVDKGLLKNIIRHTDTHNKIQEQNDMWKQWELRKQSRKQTHYPVMDEVRGYMRSDVNVTSHNEESLKWNRLLVEYEESCTDRWGHSGYKELYPEEFRNHDSNQQMEPIKYGNSSKKEKTNLESRAKKKKSNKSKKEKIKKKRKIIADCDDSDSETDHKHKKRKSVCSVKRNGSKSTKTSVKHSGSKSTKKRKKRTEHLD